MQKRWSLATHRPLDNVESPLHTVSPAESSPEIKYKTDKQTSRSKDHIPLRRTGASEHDELEDDDAEDIFENHGLLHKSLSCPA